jgi:hypothetical protein
MAGAKLAQHRHQHLVMQGIDLVDQHHQRAGALLSPGRKRSVDAIARRSGGPGPRAELGR